MEFFKHIGHHLRPRHLLLFLLLAGVVLAQHLPSWGDWYARTLYPSIGSMLSGLSRWIPFCIGDLFVSLSLVWLLLYPLYAHYRLKQGWKRLLKQRVEYLLWIYAWFYLVWGLNYSQPSLYQRTGIQPASYEEAHFLDFTRRYIDSLNRSYTPTACPDRKFIRDEVVNGYRAIAAPMGIHAPFHARPRVKTMLFTPLISKVGVTGSMAPFFCEFTLNGDLRPTQYPATYAHELAHLQGISSEAEANFYAYQVCIRSSSPSLRFSGYLSILPHVLSNARRLLPEETFRQLAGTIRPEVVHLYEANRTYWQAKYSPTLGSIQDWFYDLYLRGNKIADGRKNYSQVISLLLSWERNTPTGD